MSGPEPEVVLKLFLEELGIPAKINTVEDRKRIQKAIYLGQRANADIGYRFNWYLLGPYSPELTNVYYKLSGSVDKFGESISQQWILHPTWGERLSKIREVFNVPTDLENQLNDVDWLELLASYDFLRTVSGLDHDGAAEILRKKKPQLSGFVSHAQKSLKLVGLQQ